MIHVKDIGVDSRLLPLSFELKEGEVLHVIGPNGCGKSTLLNALSGISEYQGKVLLNDIDIRDLSLEQLAQRRAYLTQSQRPAFNLQVFQFLCLHLPLRYRARGVSTNDKKVTETVEQVCQMMNIEDKLHRSVHQLSGGEWQRVRIAANALQVIPILNPNSQLIILDEPAAPLDIGQQGLLYRFVDYMAAKGLAIVIANHDLNKTYQHADKVMMIKEGVKMAYGFPQDVMNEVSLSELYDTQVRIIKSEQESVIVT